MNRLCFSLAIAVLTFAGCGSDVTNSEQMNKSSTASATNSVESPSVLTATIFKTRLVPFKTAQGLPTQAVLVDWKNIGTRTIRAIDAEITLYDANGNAIPGGTNNYSIYATSDATAGVLPGETYREPRDQGFVLMPNGPKATRAEVRIVGTFETAGF